MRDAGGLSVLERCRAYVVAAAGCMLAACGGSGGSDAPAQNPQPLPQGPTAEDIANARASQLTSLYKANSNDLIIKWTDTFATESGYRVERQSGSGTWEVQESLPAGPATGTAYTWQRVIDRSATYRVLAQRGGYVVPLETAAGRSEIAVDLADALALLVDQADPLRGTVQLSIEGAASAASVQYFVDLNLIGTSTVAPSFSTSWDTHGVVDGGHLLLAHVSQHPGLLVELRRSTVVDNPNVAVSLSVPATSGIITLSARATSDVGIRSVEFFLNGSSIAVPTAPGSDNVWTHKLDTRGMPAGPATISVVATDNAGERAEASRQIVIDNFPTLTLQTPIDGAIVSGLLEVQGNTVDDQPGVVVTATLADVPIFETSQSPFARSYSLAGLPGGQYTLTVLARDSAGNVSSLQRAVIVSPASAFTYEVIGSFGAGTSLLDAAPDKLLYQIPDGTVRLRRANGTQVDLEGSADINPLQFVDTRVGGLWRMGSDHVATSGRLGSGPATVFLFDSAGQRQEVSYSFGAGEFETFLRSALHASWLVWGENRIYLRNLASQAPIQGPLEGRLLTGHAFVATPGSEQLFFSRETGQMQASTTVDMYRYNLADGMTTQLSGGDGRHFRPKTDAVRVAWERARHNQDVHQPPFELIVAPVNNPTASVVRSTGMVAFYLDDGVLAWVEAGPSVFTVRVDDGTQTDTLSATSSTVLYSTAQGEVIFGENGKLYTWSRAQGRRLLLDTLPRQAFQRDEVVYFTTGVSGVTIYRTTL